jgi:hypothetical protein
MKRFLLSLALLACTSSTTGTTGEAGGAKLPPAVPQVVVLGEVPDDAYAEVLPFGTFASVDALCERQRDLIVPRLAEVRGTLEVDEDEEQIVPACSETKEALGNARIALDAPFFDVRAIEVENGSGKAVFLVVRTDEGWTAVRQAILTADRNDPGCPSIEREDSIVELRVDREQLIVMTSASRGEEEGVLRLTHMRACRTGEWGTRCSEPETVESTFERVE